MSLKVKKACRKRIAQFDIVVYKVLKLVDCKYLTAYQDTEVKIGEIYESELIYHKKLNIVNLGLHSYKNLKDARLHAKRWEIRNCVIVKCIIPKHSRYYIGVSESIYRPNAISYASDKLQYIVHLK